MEGRMVDEHARQADAQVLLGGLVLVFKSQHLIGIQLLHGLCAGVELGACGREAEFARVAVEQSRAHAELQFAQVRAHGGGAQLQCRCRARYRACFDDAGKNQ